MALNYSLLSDYQSDSAQSLFDPIMFGRADEEIQALKKHQIEVEVVPGITAALAGAATIQKLLILRGLSRSVAFVTLAQCTENLAYNGGQ